MRTTVTILGLTLCLLTPRVQAADAPQKPSPEMKKLEMWAGEWEAEVTIAEAPFGDAVKDNVHATVRMVCGGYVVEVREVLANKFEEFGLINWDSDKGRYQIWYFNSAGASPIGLKPDKDEGMGLRVEGKTWVWSWTRQAKGKKYQVRHTQSFSADGNSIANKWEYSEDGTSWKSYGSGTSKRIGK